MGDDVDSVSRSVQAWHELIVLGEESREAAKKSLSQESFEELVELLDE